jgi:hypothetical protein
MMTKDTLIEEIHHDRKDVRHTFEDIRNLSKKAESKEDLTELYKQAVYMILMTHSAPLNEKDREMKRRRALTEREFTRTVHMINERAKKINVEANYSEDWENIATNGYESEAENTLEPQNTVGIVRE